MIDLADIFFTDFAQLGLGSLDRSRTQLAQGQGLPEQPRARGRGDLQRRRPVRSMLRRRRRRGRPPRDHAGHPLQPVQGSPTPATSPATADDRVGHFLNATKDFGIDRPRHQLRPDDQPLAAREGRPQGQALAPQEADRLVHRGHRPARVPARTSRRASASGTRRSRRSASATPSPSAGRRPGRDDFDPEDINYCTFRWITTDARLRHVVPAGQPADRRDDRRRRDLRRELDPVLEAGVRLPDRHAAAGRGGEAAGAAPAGRRRGDQPDPGGQDGLRPARRPPCSGAGGRSTRARPAWSPEVVPADWNALQWQLAPAAVAGPARGFCQYQHGMRPDDFGLAAIALADTPKPDADKDEDEDRQGQGEGQGEGRQEARSSPRSSSARRSRKS